MFRRGIKSDRGGNGDQNLPFGCLLSKDDEEARHKVDLGDNTWGWEVDGTD